MVPAGPGWTCAAWRTCNFPRRTRPERPVVGLYRTDSQAQLEGLLGALPLSEWMHITVTALEPHPNDPAGAAMSSQLPEPRLSQVYRLEAALGQTATQIVTGTPDLDWLNKGVFISVGGRQARSVIYETYLVA